MKKILLACGLIFCSYLGTEAQINTFDDIDFWVGEGENRAALVIRWNDGKKPDGLVWGYRWDGNATGADMLEAIATSDPRLTILLQKTASGKIVGGIGYAEDENLDLQFDLDDAQENRISRHNLFDFESLGSETAQLCLPFDSEGDIYRSVEESEITGIVRHPFDILYGLPSYDFDSWSSDNAAAHWGSGWGVGFFGYYTRDDASSTFQSSTVGASQRTLKNGSWDGYSFTNDINGKSCDMGESSSYRAATVPDAGYTSGFFILNEDWYGHQNSTINYFTDSCTWIYRVFQQENPGHELGCTSQYGTIYGGRMYIMSKQEKDPGATITGSRLAVCDARTMHIEKEFPYLSYSTENGEISSLADGRAFLGVDSHTGYIGSSNGIYLLDIDNMTIGTQIEGSGNTSGSLYEDQIGSMVRAGKYVFAVHQKKGILVIDTDNHTISHIVEGTFGSIIPARDGNLWISGSDNKLIRLNPYTLQTTEYEVSTPLPESWYAWTADPFCASYTENKIYWGYSINDDWYQNAIYCFDTDSESSYMAYDFSQYDDGGWYIYHAGFRIHPITNDIYALVYRSNTSQKYRMLKISKNANDEWHVTGEYDLERNYWFPALVIFPDNALPVVNEKFPEEISLSGSKRRYSTYLGDKVSDADNFSCTIVKSVASIDNAVPMNAYVENDSLIVELTADAGNFNTIITTAFNSNGKTVYKRTRVSTTGLSGNIENTITDSSQFPLSVYPNPATDYIRIGKTGKFQIEIFHINGHLILSKTVDGNEPVSIKSLPDGIYTIRIKTSSGIYGSRLIKQ